MSTEEMLDQAEGADEDTVAFGAPPTVSSIIPDGANAQELAKNLSPEALTNLKASMKDQSENTVLEGRYIATCPGSKLIHVKAEGQDAAVALVCRYLGCEPQQVVVAAAKRKSGPRRGDRVLREIPVAGKPEEMGYAYGVEPVE